MPTLAERIIKLLEHNPGLTDREITDSLNGHSAPQQPINQQCHSLKAKGIITRRNRSDGLIGNYLIAQATSQVFLPKVKSAHNSSNDNMSEDEVKRMLEKWLVSNGWQVRVAWGHQQGSDIDAHQGNKHWIIEVKGCGSRQAIRVNYFLGAIGELLQRMDKPEASYSLAFPDMQQFRGLWNRLPVLAKSRTGISVLFVDANGSVIQA